MGQLCPSVFFHNGARDRQESLSYLNSRTRTHLSSPACGTNPLTRFSCPPSRACFAGAKIQWLPHVRHPSRAANTQTSTLGPPAPPELGPHHSKYVLPASAPNPGQVRY